MLRSSKLIFSVVLTLAISACTKATKDPDGVNGNANGDAAATFRVDEVKGKGKTADIFNAGGKLGVAKLKVKDWSVPSAANFTLTACIEDRNTGKKAKNHQFIVEDPVTKQQFTNVPATAGNGCFSWIEKLTYDYYVERSKWIVVERDIIGTGVHVGRQRVKIALNPWAVGDHTRDNGDEVHFLREDSLSEDVLINQSDVTAKGLGEDEIYADDIDVQMFREGEHDTGMFLRLKVTIEPKVRFRNYAGEPAKNRSLGDGEFYVIGHLVARNKGSDPKNRIILTSPEKLRLRKTKNAQGKEVLVEDEYKPEMIKGQGRMINGKLIVHMNAYVDVRMPQGHLEMALMLVPKGIRGLKPFQGIYELGPLRNLSSNFSGSLTKACRDDDQCDVHKYLEGTANFFQLVNASYADSNSPYLFDRLKLRFVKVDLEETATERKVIYAASTCVINAYTGERPIGLAFDIIYKTPKADGTYEIIRKKKTEEDGCLNWDSTIGHKYYNPEQFYEQLVTIQVSTDNPNEEKVSRDMRFYINPWDDKFTFGFDEREFRPEFWKNLADGPKIKSRFFMADFGYHTVRFQYNIDDLMGLEVRKTVLMELEPRVLRYSGIVNARKMTEPLRDGIWLMKVGIQKDYLDPASVGGRIEKRDQRLILKLNKEPEDLVKENAANRLRKMGIHAPVRRFISTQTALVRSTDGVIIKPVEFNMKDLRLMRVRSNFLVQLETVNERKLWVDAAVKKPFANERERIVREVENYAASLGDQRQTSEGSAKISAFEAAKRAEIINIAGLLRGLFRGIIKYLDINDAAYINMDKVELSREQRERLRPYFSKLGFDVEKLNADLKTNDFTEVGLPNCAKTDCNQFLEPNSGLIQRTFVGPVIFLSNAYKDSVRATDNLDEACNIKTDFKNELDEELYMYEESLFNGDAERDAALAKNRQNTFYDHSQFFGSLSHLCNKNVDWLIKEEQKTRLADAATIPEQASIYNFITAYGLDFVSLRNEPMLRAHPSCSGSSSDCMVPTTEGAFPVQTAAKWMELNSYHGNGVVRSVRNLVTRTNDTVKTENWTSEDVRQSLFDRTSEFKRQYAGCALAAGHFAEKARQSGEAILGGPNGLRFKLMDYCMNSQNAVFFDRKLRVFKTGIKDNPYLFLGGYQLNVNVGQGFSVSRSNGWSWGWGLDGVDALGPMGLTGAASLAKPLSIKAGYGESLSDSAGSSISESTYLVAQIAKFSVRLDEYERCVVVKFSTPFLQELALQRIVDARQFGPYKGLFVCEGIKITEPRSVKETYFYFTQHFTEGDMLDQADLYNHPWLLALRGYRDFGSFLTLIRKQEKVTIANFVKGVMKPETRDFSWPLAHMKAAYKEITPSYPGFYTELDEYEKGPEFPLESELLSPKDMDPNQEVISWTKRINPESRRGN